MMKLKSKKVILESHLYPDLDFRLSKFLYRLDFGFDKSTFKYHSLDISRKFVIFLLLQSFKTSVQSFEINKISEQVKNTKFPTQISKCPTSSCPF